MALALSTHWNTGRHASGEAVLDEIITLGFENVELGYDLTVDLVPGVKRMVESGAVKVVSVHNYCPVPIGAPKGHPELFSLCSLNPGIRHLAVKNTTTTLEFAAEIGAGVVVTHAGRVEMKDITGKLISLAEAGRQYDTKYEKLKLKLMMARQKKAAKHFDALIKSIEQLSPTMERTSVKLALEIVPSWEALPSELEMERLLKLASSPLLGYWHDIGHGRIRHNLGLISEASWLEKLGPSLVGFHAHDVANPAVDHLMPPRGNIDFSVFRPYVKPGMPLVIEPAPGTPPGQIKEGAEVIRSVWLNEGDGEAPAPQGGAVPRARATAGKA